MTGSLQEKKGVYYAVIRLADETGKMHQKWTSTGIKVEGNNKRKANAFLRELLTKMEQYKTKYSKETLFVDWIDKWMEQKKYEVRTNTFEGYQLYIDTHIKPFFLPLKLTLNEVTSQHIQDYYNKKQKNGLSANSIKKHNVIIKGSLHEALKKKLIPFNPVDGATLPRPEKYIGKAYTAEQANELLKVVENDPIKPAVILALFYGLRRSEVLGLRWEDIDFKKNTLLIRNTVVKLKTTIEHEKTKSRASNRTLFIIPETRDYFVNLQRIQNENQLLMGAAYISNNHVCRWDNGEPFKPDYITKHFEIVIKKNGLPKLNFHGLRHTTGSLLLNKGLSAKQIQEYLGHEQISTTLDIYGHLDIEGKREASETLGSLLESIT
ncbi:MAG: site-specific integrase [Clostridiales bacterium]|jgi:integrase|nr:site-specific integrase [Clostridiales bacterium]